MIGRHRCWVLAVAVVVLTAPGCRSPESLAPDVITVALANSPVNLDPRVGSDESSQKLHQLLYNSLLRVGEDLRLKPELASAIEQPDELT